MGTTTEIEQQDGSKCSWVWTPMDPGQKYFIMSWKIQGEWTLFLPTNSVSSQLWQNLSSSHSFHTGAMVEVYNTLVVSQVNKATLDLALRIFNLMVRISVWKCFISHLFLKDAISCGGHSASDCASCGPNESFCYGDCVWEGDHCVNKQDDHTSGKIFSFLQIIK